MKNIKNFIIGTITMAVLAANMGMSPAFAALGDQTLRPGMEGQDVKELQVRLNDLGFTQITADGIFGETTEQAIIELQNAKNIDADGIVGQATFQVLLGDRGPEVSRGSAPGRYKTVLAIKATAYAPGPHDNGQWGNLTYMGTQIRPGVIAVDPRVIPLGSRLYIEFADGNGMYGVAEDTGGAIKGNRIDIAMVSVDKAYDFGVQNVKVYVLS
ncbi:3D domain-containing protein [Sporomusa sp.]|jgi:3D (Asp-Asp-Asp) domain-containing protein|uniref:3D domain-containing protein n=1 Tax=Sporomusa sp. TaxID=2078658 RepID=UPI002B807DF9|nr:3D domain-containing protein [Sporomusa sp.]HWR07531.1 3D domain-containing protein [Sporomusa sp.]